MSRADNGNDNVGFIVNVNIPLRRDRIGAKVRQAEHRAAEQEQRYEALRDETVRLVRRLIAQAETLDQQIALHRDGIVPTAEDTYLAAQDDYAEGRVDFQQLIENWINLLNTRIQLVLLQARFAQTLASLDRVAGCDFEGRHSSFNPARSEANTEPLPLPPP